MFPAQPRFHGRAAAPMAQGGQVRFPATQNPSSDANTLDDYEEGSWTPVLEGASVAGSHTYSVQTGRYIKIGAFVWITCTISLSAFGGTTSGDMKITGLPFTASNITGLSGPLNVGNFKDIDLNVAGGYYFPSIEVQKGDTIINLSEGGDNQAVAPLTEADFGNGSAIRVAGTYSVGLS